MDPLVQLGSFCCCWQRCDWCVTPQMFTWGSFPRSWSPPLTCPWPPASPVQDILWDWETGINPGKKYIDLTEALILQYSVTHIVVYVCMYLFIYYSVLHQLKYFTSQEVKSLGQSYYSGSGVKKRNVCYTFHNTSTQVVVDFLIIWKVGGSKMWLGFSVRGPSIRLYVIHAVAEIFQSVSHPYINIMPST